jgi:hypothetical protein
MKKALLFVLTLGFISVLYACGSDTPDSVALC